MKPREIPVCGLAAVRAHFAADAAAIKRLYFDYATGRKIGVICQALAQAKKVYRCVESAELEKIAGTVHHGGIVAVIAAPELRAPRPEDIRAWAQRRAPLLLLDRIGNAHNLGAIARTAAFLGVEKIVIPDDPRQARPGEAAHRVAEGGLAQVELFLVSDLAAFCRELRPHYFVVGAAVRGEALAPQKTDGHSGKPIALALGNEEEGLSAAMMAACERLVRIPGTGKVESLNVSAAAAILLWQFFGRR